MSRPERSAHLDKAADGARGNRLPFQDPLLPGISYYVWDRGEYLIPVPVRIARPQRVCDIGAAQATIKIRPSDVHSSPCRKCRKTSCIRGFQGRRTAAVTAVMSRVRRR